MSQRHHEKNKEMERLEALLTKVHESGGMNFEKADGFFTALLCIPEHIPPSDFIPIVLGDAPESLESDIEEIVTLLLNFYEKKQDDCRRFNFKVTPAMRPNPQGVITGKEWCSAFLHCLAYFDYMSVFDENEDEDSAIVFVPFLALASEGFPADESGMIITPLTPQQREELIQALPRYIQAFSAFLGDYFSEDDDTGERQAINAKIPRNNPCPCGSGKKYKKCCMP